MCIFVLNYECEKIQVIEFDCSKDCHHFGVMVNKKCSPKLDYKRFIELQSDILVKS